MSETEYSKSLGYVYAITDPSIIDNNHRLKEIEIDGKIYWVVVLGRGIMRNKPTKMDDDENSRKLDALLKEWVERHTMNFDLNKNTN